MSVDGSRQSMKGVEVGSAGPTEDEEGWSGLRPGDLRYDPVSVQCRARFVLPAAFSMGVCFWYI